MTDKFPADKGSYLLWLFLPRGADLTIGKLGCHHFSRGWYLYCGSAFGPGGLRARIGHHLKHSDKKHWHIDYLKSKATSVRSGSVLEKISNTCGVGNWPIWQKRVIR